MPLEFLFAVSLLLPQLLCSANLLPLLSLEQPFDRDNHADAHLSRERIGR